MTDNLEIIQDINKVYNSKKSIFYCLEKLSKLYLDKKYGRESFLSALKSLNSKDIALTVAIELFENKENLEQFIADNDLSSDEYNFD